MKKILIISFTSVLSLSAFANESSNLSNLSEKSDSSTLSKPIASTTIANGKSTAQSKQIAKSIASNTVATNKNASQNQNVVLNISCTPDSPCYVIKNTSEQVLSSINKGLSPKQTMKLITNVITPQFNFELMTKYAMGQNWKQATSSEQQKLVEYFKNLLIYTYSSALSKFRNAKITINNQNVAEKKAAVITLVMLPNAGDNAQPIKVEYDLAKLTDEDTWKVYDIKIENASLVTTYRNQFNSIVATSNVSGLIKQLKTKVDNLQKVTKSE